VKRNLRLYKTFIVQATGVNVIRLFYINLLMFFASLTTLQM
jgi:hypothetical protein